MGHQVHRAFTAVGYSPGFVADISALSLSLADRDIGGHLVTAMGRNGYLSVSLLPHGGKSLSDWDKEWVGVKVQLRNIARLHRAEWFEITWGGDHEGSPFVETDHYKADAGGVMIGKMDGFGDNPEIDPDR